MRGGYREELSENSGLRPEEEDLTDDLLCKGGGGKEGGPAGREEKEEPQHSSGRLKNDDTRSLECTSGMIFECIRRETRCRELEKSMKVAGEVLRYQNRSSGERMISEAVGETSMRRLQKKKRKSPEIELVLSGNP